MQNRFTLLIVIISLVLGYGAIAHATPPPQGEDDRIIVMGRATWDTGWFQAEIFKQLLEELGYQVVGPRTQDNPDFYTGLAQGEFDLWANGWFPSHNSFIEDVEEEVAVVGFEVRAGALQGYMIDRRTADEFGIENLSDLQDPEIAQIFDQDNNGKADLIGCNVGWGCELLIEHHLDAYDLRDTVEHIQGDYSPLMLNTIEQYRQGRPILFFTWTPNWTIGALQPGQDVVWLEVPFASLPADQADLEAETTIEGMPGCVADPCQMGFPPNDIRAVANRDFLDANPGVEALLQAIEIPLADISAQNALFLEGEDEPADIRRHAAEWIAQNRTEVDRWLAEARALMPDSAEPVPTAPTDSTVIIPEITETLRVATKPTPPFVIYENRQYSGFSIELWEAIAAELNVEYELYGVNSVAKLLDEAERGSADLVTAGLGITASREQNLDFSHAFFESGLQIMVPDTSGQLFNGFLPGVFATIFAPEFLYIIGSLLVMLLVSAHVIWFFERDNDNPDFPNEYRSGIWEAFWWSAVTVTTVGYGDKTPKGVLGRLFGLFWMFAGLFILAYFTAGVTSTVTLQGLQGSISGPDDLPGKTVATIEESVAAEFLVRQGMRPVLFESEQDAYHALENGDVQAFVHDAPVLQHYASHEGQGKVEVVGLVFEELSYGIAFEHDSPYREAVNLALLHLIEDGTYQELHDKWFGAESE